MIQDDGLSAYDEALTATAILMRSIIYRLTARWTEN
jgi:hypothetical protein